MVYAQPLELYPGSTLSQADVSAELERLGYRQLSNPRDPGSYRRSRNHLDIHLRAFQFMERFRASQQISVDFDAAGIASITDVTGRPIPLIRLDPLNIGSFFPSHGEDRIVLPPDHAVSIPILNSACFS